MTMPVQLSFSLHFYLLRRRSQQRELLCIDAVHLFVRPFVCRSVCLSPIRDFLKKTKQITAMVSIDELWEVLNGLFKEPFRHIRHLKFKLAEIHRLEVVKSPSQRNNHPILMKFSKQMQI